MEQLLYRKYLKELRKTIKSNEVEEVLNKLAEDKKSMKMTEPTAKAYKLTLRELKKRFKIKKPYIQKESSGEKKIREYLVDRQINFKQEYEFNDLCNPKSKCKLRFDFYLPEYNTLIEFDGKQHFEYVKEFDKGDKRKLLSRQYRDKLKNEYCLTKKLVLIRIPYTEYFNIEKILNNYFQK